MEERHAKGLQSRPLETGFFIRGLRRGDVPTLYVFALVQLTRFRPVRGVLRTASTDSIVLLRLRRKRQHFKNTQPDLWSAVGWLRKFYPFNRTVPQGHFLRRCFAPPSGRSTQRRGDKRSAPQGYLLRGTEADLIASKNLLRGGRHKARQNGPKHYPRGFKGIAIPLARLSPLSFAVQRKMEPPEVAGQAARPVKT